MALPIPEEAFLTGIVLENGVPLPSEGSCLEMHEILVDEGMGDDAVRDDPRLVGAGEVNDGRIFLRVDDFGLGAEGRPRDFAEERRSCVPMQGEVANVVGEHNIQHVLILITEEVPVLAFRLQKGVEGKIFTDAGEIEKQDTGVEVMGGGEECLALGGVVGSEVLDHTGVGGAKRCCPELRQIGADDEV